ncbi:MAG: photosynthetic protein synthase I [Gammaproteobacteria bacterium HGW-Gammaproteobacteria-10]|nr:MAG: photosynthetic protein synthase I [Gammaproteobacteria bacterium HGW-Gammaproteobacteria-10]
MKHLFTIVILLSSVAVFSVKADNETLAPGYGALQYELPTVGSYLLPALGKAADGKILDEQGQAVNLHQLMGDKIVLLSFIYSTCSDVNGCPLATGVFHKIKNRLKKTPELAKQLRLLTLSFNPEQDTPDKMKQYGEHLHDENIEWRFLTTASETELRPILDHYRQSIQKVYDENGRFTGTFSHILRVYLIDRNKKIRNIYSVSFLHTDTLINDVKTLLQPVVVADGKKPHQVAERFRPGDDKSNYESGDYETRSIALADRAGKTADLMKTVYHPPKGLPPVPIPANNPVTPEKVQLGRKLFYDRRLSLNNTFSCAMCHIPEQGFTSNEMKTAVGIEGRTVKRNSPTLYNVAYYTKLFHDGRENSLEHQVWGPLLAHNEMANPSIGSVIEKLHNDREYNALFNKAFGKGPTIETIGMAIASYERTLNSGNSSFDRWYYSNDKRALNNSAQRGFKLFSGKAQCSSCHSVSKKHALFTDNAFHNTGIGYREAMHNTAKTQRVQVAPGVFVDVDNKLIASVSETKNNDLGRYEVTQDPNDRWHYRTPSLRNVALTAPYMHNGSISTLKEVVEFYNQGGINNENLDPLINPLNLNNAEIDDLTAFLESLTGDNIDELVADAFAAPVGDHQEN